MPNIDNRLPVAQQLLLQDAQSSYSQTRTQKKTHKQTETLSQTEKAQSDGDDTVATAASGRSSRDNPGNAASVKSRATPHDQLVKKATSMMSQAARLAMSLDAEAARLEKDPIGACAFEKGGQVGGKVGA